MTGGKRQRGFACGGQTPGAPVLLGEPRSGLPCPSPPRPPVGHVPQRLGFNLWCLFLFGKQSLAQGGGLRVQDAVLSGGLPRGAFPALGVSGRL